MVQTRQKVFRIVPKCPKMPTLDASLSERTCFFFGSLQLVGSYSSPTTKKKFNGVLQTTKIKQNCCNVEHGAVNTQRRFSVKPSSLEKAMTWQSPYRANSLMLSRRPPEILDVYMLVRNLSFFSRYSGSGFFRVTTSMLATGTVTAFPDSENWGYGEDALSQQMSKG